MLTGYDVYKEYIALKCHFTQTNYDYNRYKGKTKVTLEQFNNRKDYYQFNKIAKQCGSLDKAKELFISNFVAGKINQWSGYYATKEAMDIYYKWKRGVTSLAYILEEECKKIKSFMDGDKVTMKDLLLPKEGQHPLLLRYFIAGEISLETLMAFMIKFKLLSFWKTIADPVIWPDILKLILKYREFVDYDKVDIGKIISKIFVLGEQKT